MARDMDLAKARVCSIRDTGHKEQVYFRKPLDFLQHELLKLLALALTVALAKTP